MAPRARNRSRDLAAASPDAPVVRRSAHPMFSLQRMIGNRAIGQVLSRTPAKTDLGTVQIGKLPAIKITGGNAGDWAAKKDADALEIVSETGGHSSELARLAKDHSRVPSLLVTVPITDQGGDHLDFGSVQIEFVNAHIDYTVEGKIETWRAIDFDAVHRTRISRKSGV